LWEWYLHLFRRMHFVLVPLADRLWLVASSSFIGLLVKLKFGMAAHVRRIKSAAAHTQKCVHHQPSVASRQRFWLHEIVESPSLAAQRTISHHPKGSSFSKSYSTDHFIIIFATKCGHLFLASANEEAKKTAKI
jgi:hypothetical protein